MNKRINPFKSREDLTRYERRQANKKLQQWNRPDHQAILYMEEHQHYVGKKPTINKRIDDGRNSSILDFSEDMSKR